MKIILKQFLKTIFKKWYLIACLFFSLIVIVTMTSASSFVSYSIALSGLNIDRKGEASDIIMDNIKPTLKIDYDGTTLPSLSTTKSINMNGLDPATEELTIFAASKEDYLRLPGTKNPNWNKTASNNQNYLSTSPTSPGELISPSLVNMFLANGVMTYHLSHRENSSSPIKVSLDPRSLAIGIDKDGSPKVIGIYKDFKYNNEIFIPQSIMGIKRNQENNINEKSLKNISSLRYILPHKLVENIQTLDTKNREWNIGKYWLWETLNYFENIPDTTTGMLQPEPSTGIPFFQNEEAIEINLKLDTTNFDSMTKLYFNSLSNLEKEKVENVKFHLNAFQVSNGTYKAFAEIPTTPEWRDNIKGYIKNYIHNFIIKERTSLSKSVLGFSKEVIINTLNSNYHNKWASSESILIQRNEQTFLFATREDENINKIITTIGQKLYTNADFINVANSFSRYNGDSISFWSVLNLLREIQKTDYLINEPNNYTTNGAFYTGSTEIRQTTAGWRRGIDVIKDTYEELDSIDRNPENNSLLTWNPSDDAKKRDLIIKTPIWYEFMLVFGNTFRIESFHGELNNVFSYVYGRNFSPLTKNSATITKINLENFGIVISSGYFEKRKLKVIPANNESDIVIVDSGIEKKILSFESMRQQIKELSVDPNFNPSNWLNLYLKQVPDDFKINIGTNVFLITGAGNSPDYKSPIIDLTRPIPNASKEAVIYVNKSQFSAVAGIYPNDLFNKDISINIGTEPSFIKVIDEIIVIKALFQKIMPGTNFNFYENNDFINNPNILTYRWSYLILINSIVSISLFILIITLLATVLYVLVMIIKFIFDALKFGIAISRANGISRHQIILSLLTIILGLGLVLSIIAFVSGYFIASLFFPVLSGFILTPLLLPTFPIWSIIVLIMIVFLVIGGTVTLISLSILNKPLLLTLSGNDIVTSNKLSGLLRTNKMNITPFNKLKLSMLSSKVGKISLISSLVGLSLGTTTAVFTISSKINEAGINNTKSKNYTYSFDYAMPQYQNGLLKLQEFSNLGEIDLDKGIDTNLKHPSERANDPYYALTYQSGFSKENRVYLANPLTAKRNAKGEILYRDAEKTIPRTYENYILPSIYAYSGLNYGSNFTFNIVLSAFVMDLTINPFFGIQIGNLWDHVSQTLPLSLSVRLKSNLENYREAIVNKYPWYRDSFLKQNPDLSWKIPYELDSSKVVKIEVFPPGIRYNDNYLKALGIIFADEELNNKNTLISFGYTANDSMDETYTYVTGTLKHRDFKNKTKDIKLTGISNQSKVIKLYNDYDQPLNHLVASNSNHVIVNKGAAYKNNIKVGDKIEVQVKNDYYESVKNLLWIIGAANKHQPKTRTLEVVGISVDSIGENYWINQDYANELINLSTADHVTNLPSPNLINTNLLTRQKLSANQKPFNGIFTNSPTPKIDSISIPLLTKSGLYPIGFEVKSLYNYILDDKTYNQMVDLYTPTNFEDPEIIKIYSSVGIQPNLNPVDKIAQFKEIIKKSTLTPKNLIDKLEENYQNVNIIPTIVGMDGIAISDQLFSLISTATNLLGIIIALTLVPILIITMIISMISLADDFKKTLSIIRILGFSKRQSISAIAIIYLPILVIGLIIGLLFTFLINLGLQFIAINTLSIFLTTTINGAVFGWATGALILIVLFSLLITTIILIKEKLEKAIKF